MTKCIICNEYIPPADVAVIDGLPFCPRHDEDGMGLCERVDYHTHGTGVSIHVEKIVAGLVTTITDLTRELAEERAAVKRLELEAAALRRPHVSNDFMFGEGV